MLAARERPGRPDPLTAKNRSEAEMDAERHPKGKAKPQSKRRRGREAWRAKRSEPTARPMVTRPPLKLGRWWIAVVPGWPRSADRVRQPVNPDIPNI